MHAVVTEDWHLLSKKGIKNRENDESVSIPLYVFEVIKCVTYHACQVLHSIWCPCPLRRGVWEGNWWGILWGKWDRRGLQNIDKKHIHHSDICMHFHVESYYFHSAQRNKSVRVWLIVTTCVCGCVCVFVIKTQADMINLVTFSLCLFICERARNSVACVGGCGLW